MVRRSDEIRDKYIKNPPEGTTADDIRHMSEDDLLTWITFKVKQKRDLPVYSIRQIPHY